MCIDVFKQWIDALRSGDYVQGHHPRIMHSTQDTWSVLGVLADISVDGWWEPSNYTNCYVLKIKIAPDHYASAVAAIPWTYYPGRYPKSQDKFITLEEFGLSFLDIADILEKQYHRYMDIIDPIPFG